MEKIFLCNDQLAKCKQLISGINRVRCNGSFRGALKIFRDYAKRNPCAPSLLDAFMKLLTKAAERPPVNASDAAFLLEGFIRKLLAESECAVIHLPMVYSYLAVKHRKARCVATVSSPRDVVVELSGRYRRCFPRELLDEMAVGQVFPCGHWCGRFVTDYGHVDQFVSRLHCFLVRTEKGFKLYDCSLNGTSIVLA